MKFQFTRCFASPYTFLLFPAPPRSETLHLLPWPVEKKATLRSAHPCYSILMCLLHDIAQNSSEVMLVGHYSCYFQVRSWMLPFCLLAIFASWWCAATISSAIWNALF